VTVNPRGNTSTVHSVQPVYIKEYGKVEPEDVKELTDDKSFELPFPLQKEILLRRRHRRVGLEGNRGQDIPKASLCTLIKYKCYRLCVL
jgi:hypothetical protein